MIINSTTLRSEYPRISEQARETGEPIYITMNGEGDTVLMSIDSYEQLIERVKLTSSILDAERDRLAGNTDYSIDEVSGEMRRIIDAKRV